MTPLQLLTFVNLYGIKIEIQDLGPTVRQKNRVLFTYRCPQANEVLSIGAGSVGSAIAKAAQRSNEVLRARILNGNRRDFVDDILEV